ncbi:MAG: hypothetical protein ACMUEM_04400 [Flavobacteriales bacterium AspAUS03]
MGFNDLGSVSGQIITYLESEKILTPDQLKEMYEFFRTPDWVKFAKLKPKVGETQKYQFMEESFLEATYVVAYARY